jgi:hypothetical protein
MTDRSRPIVPDQQPAGRPAVTRWPHPGRGADVEHRARQAERRAADAERRVEKAEEQLAARDRRIDALLRAVDSRGPIEQAKGVVMGVFGLDSEKAFDALVWVSQHANVKLGTVAERFLADLRGLDLGAQCREDITQLLASMSRAGGAYFV